jgi:hypothetical protein
MFDRLSYFTLGFLPDNLNNPYKYYIFLSNPNKDFMKHFKIILNTHLKTHTMQGTKTLGLILAEDICIFNPNLNKNNFIQSMEKMLYCKK